MEIDRSHVDRALRIAAWYGRKTPRMEQADLDGSALEGLAHAAKRWDGERDFWKFAVPRIFGAMTDELRRADHLTRDLRSAANDDGVVDELAYIHAASPVSMSRSVHGEATLADVVQERRSDLSDLETRDAILRALELLDERERAVLLLIDIDGYTNGDVAEAWGLSFGRVSQLRTRALGRVRAHFDDCLLDAA